MMNKSILIILLTMMVSCSTNERTRYGPSYDSSSGGYNESQFRDGTYLARFSANAFTHPDYAFIFSQFRAIELCYEEGYKFARILNIENRSQSQQVTKSSSFNYQTPTNITGSYNSNTTYNLTGNHLNSTTNGQFNGTITGGHTFGSGQSWNETYHYPTFDTYFVCENQHRVIGVMLKELTSDIVRSSTKDYLGAIVIEEIFEESPNKNRLKVGDLIIRASGKRVQRVSELQTIVKKSSSKVKLEIIRDGKKKTLNLNTYDVSDKIVQANIEVVNKGCAVEENSKRSICSGSARGISSER